MKVKLSSVIKTTYHEFDCFEEQQYIFRAGNTLCIKQLGKNECEFICLNKQIKQLKAFKPMNNRKGVFTAEITQQGVEIGQYNLKSQRKMIPLEGTFFTEMNKVELLVDQYDNNLVYGTAKNKEGMCVFLVDFSKGRTLAMGYMPHFEDIKVDTRDNMTLSVCGHNGVNNYVKILKYGHNQWQSEQQIYKKIPGNLIKHEILLCARSLLAIKTAIYIYEQNNEVQILQMPEGIADILKIPRGFLVRLENQTIKLLVEDSNEITFIDKGVMGLRLQEGDYISKMVITHNNEEILLRTMNNNMYKWNCEHIDLQPGHDELSFNQIQSSCRNQAEGSISISTGKRYCLMSSPTTVTLWSIEKNQFVLSSQFISSEQKEKKNILACAINPNGNSLMLAFEDRIKIYHILLTKFKFFADFPIRRCQKIQYSHGGQLAACHYGRGNNACIIIYNILRLVEVCTFKIQAQPLQIIWNELDDELLVTTQNHTILTYKIGDSTRLSSIKFQNQIRNARIDYKTHRLLVSTIGKIWVVNNGKIMDELDAPFDDFSYIFPLYGMYFIVGMSGTLYWSQSLRFETYCQYSIFTNKPFSLVCRNSYMLAYSNFSQVTIIHCERMDHNKKALIDDIVMVEKDQVLGLFDKVKILESNFDMLQSATQIKLEEERNNYNYAIQELKHQFTQEITFLNAKFGELGMEKIKQEKEAQSLFEKVEKGQMRSVNQLEKMYERNFVIEKEKYMNLQQQMIEQKLSFQKIILDLQNKYHKDITQIREEYKKKVTQECQRVQQLNKNKLADKRRMETRLLDLQEQNEVILTSLQQQKDEFIKQLQIKIIHLEEDFDSEKVRNQNQLEKIEELENEKAERKIELDKYGYKLEESMNRIKLLENQVISKNQMIEQRDQIIKEYEHQIGGLQKAKYVLSFRTTQIRKELQPKEALVDKLTSNLQKLHQEYNDLKNKLFEQDQKIQKLTQISQCTKKQNMDLKTGLKQKERIHDQLCYQIYIIKTSMDQSKWNQQLVKLYQTYVKEDKFKSRLTKKQDATAEEINRHLIHVEKSLEQVSKGNTRVMRGKEKEVHRKMKQNQELILELNVLRTNEKKYKNEKTELMIDNDRLKREINESRKTSRRNSTRAQTAVTSGLTRRMVASRDAISREKSALIDLSELQGYDLKSRNKEKSRVGSAHKTLMFRDDRFEKSSKLIEMVKELQSARNTIKVQDEMIEELNKQLFGIEQKEDM